MGVSGVAIFSDDLAADVRDDFRELIGEGLSSTEATQRLMIEYASSLDDPEEMPVFWIALAVAQWKLGRLDEQTQQMALRVIDEGTDLARWDDPKDRTKRKVVLEKTRIQLLSPPPQARRVPRTLKEDNQWLVGEVVAIRLLSGKWTLICVIGHYSDEGGRFAVCELLNWVGDAIPSLEITQQLKIVRQRASPHVSQFIFQEPRKKKDRSRMLRTGLSIAPQQTIGGFTALVWPQVDRQLEKLFGLR